MPRYIRTSKVASLADCIVYGLYYKYCSPCNLLASSASTLFSHTYNVSIDCIIIYFSLQKKTKLISSETPFASHSDTEEKSFENKTRSKEIKLAHENIEFFETGLCEGRQENKRNDIIIMDSINLNNKVNPDIEGSGGARNVENECNKLKEETKINSDEILTENTNGDKKTQNIQQNDQCNICGQFLNNSDIIFYQGHPQDSVEEFIALTNEKLVLASGIKYTT